jgi:hypothetical protein
MSRAKAKTIEKTIRAGRQWVKIIRDAGARSFTFARGYAGEFKAHEIHSYPFAAVPTWAAAIEHATRCISIHAPDGRSHMTGAVVCRSHSPDYPVLVETKKEPA